jgi:type II secretory ATPase GspE/PulE/Tfp pilus assembly ATPase PilB-like protein
MPATPSALQARLNEVPLEEPHRVVAIVDLVLDEVVHCGASDVHFEPTPHALDVRFRIDGVIRHAAVLPRELCPNVVARLKVMSELLTYRTDVPQEGGIRNSATKPEMRVSTFPTVHGEKAVVRVFQATTIQTELEHLGMPDNLLTQLTGLLNLRSGAVYLTGPSGSGKTTTIYACLRWLLREGMGRHVVTIEDPVEQLVEGATQSQVRPGTEFDFARGLRSLLRQDPDVLMVGEIRDPDTAAVASEAALTGHLVFSTLHAGSAAGVIGRLLEMGIEPHVLTSGLKGILNQRLLRRICAACRAADGSGQLECDTCLGTGYRGRFLIAELLTLDATMRRSILARADTDELEHTASKLGLKTIRGAALAAVAAGHTTAEEVERVLGPEAV